jgi:predicted nucleic acid-binding protein
VIVADASAIIEILLRLPLAEPALDRLFRDGESVHAPALVDLEIAQVLRRYVRCGDMTAARARASLDLLEAFPMHRYMHEPLLGRIWALRENLTAYDAAYVALAEGLGAPLLTCDSRLANAPDIHTTVEVLGA